MPKLSTHDAKGVDMGVASEASEELEEIALVESHMTQRARALSSSPR
jgi:hypothetical protein